MDFFSLQDNKKIVSMTTKSFQNGSLNFYVQGILLQWKVKFLSLFDTLLASKLNQTGCYIEATELIKYSFWTIF